MKLFSKLFAKKERIEQNIPDESCGENCRERGILFRMSDDHLMYDAFLAENHDEETWQLIREIEERVEILVKRGVSEQVLKLIVEEPREVSRLVVTNDYRIILPEYQDMEIMMTPLVKAVYLLFLEHPEGIIFKYLDDYRDELREKYEAIKGEACDAKMMQSINDITDPTKNSINEKVARIREAFITRFDKRLAINYIIHGERGEAKYIPLHREFVECFYNQAK